MKIILLPILAALLSCMGVAGCGPTLPETPADTTADATADAAYEIGCEEPRPRVCTREYRPVCALRDTGIRCVTTPCDSTEWRTFGNGCTACSDADVYGYKAGECPE